MHDSTKAEQVFSFIPQAGTHPPPQQKQLWEEILKVIPTDLSAIDRALHPIAEKHIRATSHDARLPFLIDYSRAVIRHHFPDKRALALVKSHFILLVKFGRTSAQNVACLQAHVHPSVRGNLTHYPFLMISLDPPQNDFRIVEGSCSCSGGCVQYPGMTSHAIGAMEPALTSKHCSSHSSV